MFYKFVICIVKYFFKKKVIVKKVFNNLKLFEFFKWFIVICFGYSCLLYVVYLL